MSYIRLDEIKYAIRLSKNGLTFKQIKSILESCTIPKKEAEHLAILGRKIYNKTIK